MTKTNNKSNKFYFNLFSLILFFLCLWIPNLFSQTTPLDSIFKNPPESAKPWVYWYWMNAAVSREGITADLEAMKEAGIAGAYIFTIKGVTDPPLFEPPAEQLTTEWWDMLSFAFNEANRLGLKLGFHFCDGFTTGGGPWITPEMSMKKVVWSDTIIQGSQLFDDMLSQPPKLYDYYSEIAVFALPIQSDYLFTTTNIQPKITTSIPGIEAQFLAQPTSNEVFRSENPCWIQYAFEKPFTCRSIKIKAHGNNLQSLRLKMETSDDGIHFGHSYQMEPPRHGWQDSEFNHTYAIPPVTAKYYRFSYDKEGTEPGSEDFDAAKWKQSLKIEEIELSGMPRIDQFEGKSGAIWRVSPRTTSGQLPDSLCIPLNNVINISDKIDKNGHLSWVAPAGTWMILRMGCTTTGHTNYIGDGAVGLECDKLNPDAVRIQFDHWFGKLLRKLDTASKNNVLKMLHVDSWECGSQNWSPVFRNEFLKRCGYDVLPYLPVFAGIPLENTEKSENVLYDVRKTINELVNENFFGTLSTIAKDNDLDFSAENPSPVMICDGMQPFEYVDIPMGEFWLNSPTHDKPTDILDAVSAAHIYGKNIVQAEGFTTLRMTWNEYPGMMKTLQDRNYALGINRLVYHVFTQNPWMDRKPGMTLNGVGLYFQRDQTWWKSGKAWIEYATRCQSILHQGIPVEDIAVFTGEEIPRRALTPDRLVNIMPGLFGKEKIEQEKIRLKNKDIPLHDEPVGVTNTVNTFRPEEWTDPLHGYHYDSFNKDALLRLAKVSNGKIEMPGGMSYNILVIPGKRKMSPDGNRMSPEVADKLLQLVEEGATIMLEDLPEKLIDRPDSGQYKLSQLIQVSIPISEIEAHHADHKELLQMKLGKGKIIIAPYYDESLENVGITRDFEAKDANGNSAKEIEWTHRKSDDFEFYFISNQTDSARIINFSLRVSGYLPELFDPVTGEISWLHNWKIKNGRTELPLRLEPNGSAFLIFSKPTQQVGDISGINWSNFRISQFLSGNYRVTFSPEFGGPKEPIEFKKLFDWSTDTVFGLKYYSGTARYVRTFEWTGKIEKNQSIWLDLGRVSNLADIKINNIPCGIVWTSPYRVEISDALRKGTNQLKIEVTTTWHNRLIGDHNLPEEERITWTTAPYRLDKSPLTESGLLGPVTILTLSDE